MAGIAIIRPNGEEEHAEVTMDETLVGVDKLEMEQGGKSYYAKLAPEISTHMFYIKPDGTKLYVQKELAFKWKFELSAEEIDGITDSEIPAVVQNKLKDIVIPKAGRYKLKRLHILDSELGEGRNEIIEFERFFRANQAAILDKEDGYCLPIQQAGSVRLFYTDSGQEEDLGFYNESNTIISIEYISDN